MKTFEKMTDYERELLAMWDRLYDLQKHCPNTPHLRQARNSIMRALGTSRDAEKSKDLEPAL